MEENKTEEDTILPSFMSENTEENEQTQSESFIGNNLHTLMIGISVLWFLIVGIYITKFFGWDNLFLLMPSEFGGFLAGITLPLAVIWVVIAYIDRGSSFKNEAKLLRAYMNQLVYPEDGAASTAKAMADAIREQVAELREVTKLATEKTAEIKSELSSKVEEFSKLVKILDEYSDKTINQLNLGVSSLIENCNFVTSQTQTMTGDFMDCAEKIKTQVSDLTVGMTPMLQDVRNMAIMLNDLFGDNEKKISSAKQNFVEYAELFSQINERVDTISTSIQRQKESVDDQAKTLDESSQYLDGKLGEYGRLIGMEVEAMVGRAATLDENLQEQVKAVKNATAEISMVFDALKTDIEQKNSVVLEASKTGAQSIAFSSKTIDEEIKRLENFAAVAERKNAQIAEVASKTAEKLDGISSQISANIDVLKQKAVETIDVFNNVAGNVKKNMLSMVEASTQITTQSKAGEVALSKQNSELSATYEQVLKTMEELRTLSDSAVAAINSNAQAVEGYKATVETLSQSLSEQEKTAQQAADRSHRLIKEMDERYSGRNIAAFFGDAEEIVNSLESVAVDLNKVLTPEDEDSLWKKYYNGDKSAFVRHLAKSLSKKQIVAIHEKYESDDDFRTTVNRYMNEFDRLLEIAKKNEMSEVLTKIVCGSNIGNVYYIIAKALNKMD